MKELFYKLFALYKAKRDIIDYLFWGVMTTIVNYGAYFACTRLAEISYFWSNIYAWLIAVLFGFVVNKTFVFRSYDWTAKVAFRECWQFIAARIFSGALETGSLVLFVDILHCNDAIVKIIAGFVVVVLNYIFSKFIIFAKKKQYKKIIEH